MDKRIAKVDEALTDPVMEILNPIIKNHGMMYGPTFDTGIELAMFVSNVTKFIIATLMEKNKLMKSLPGTSKKEKELESKDKHPGTYL